MNSSRTPSRNQVAVYIKSVSFHSSYFARLRELKQQTKEWFSSVCKTISEHMLVMYTLRPFFLYDSGFVLLTLPRYIMYGSPVCLLFFKSAAHLCLESLSPASNFLMNLSPTTAHWWRLSDCLLTSPLGSLISNQSIKSSCSMLRLTEAAPLLTAPWFVAKIVES